MDASSSSSRQNTETLANMEEDAAHDSEHDVEDIKKENTAEHWNREEEQESIDNCRDPKIKKHVATVNHPISTIPELRLEMFEQKRDHGNYMIHLAASVGDLGLVKRIAEQHPLQVLKQNNKGNLPLHLAASAGHLSTVRFLVLKVYNCFQPAETSNWLLLKNKRENTALHVAVENKQKDVAKFLIETEGLKFSLNRYDKPTRDNFTEERWKGKSVLRAAILGGEKDIVDIVLQYTSPSLVRATDEEGMTALTLGAYRGDSETVKSVLAMDGGKAAADKVDKNGFTPIHLASRKGHITIVELLLNHFPQQSTLLDENHWTILHTAVWYRRDKLVTYIIGKLHTLINGRDIFGNTPLHLAVRQGYPKTVRILASNERVNLSVTNEEGHSAMDIARMSLMGEKTLFLRRPLTVMALNLANASRSPQKSISSKSKPTKANYFHDTKQRGASLSGVTKQRGASLSGVPQDASSHIQTVNNLLLVSTLVATVTFTAGFTMPGGYVGSGSDQGKSPMVTNWPFQIFLICNTIAMYSSSTVAIGLLWAQTGDMSYACAKFGLPILGVALSMMLVAFMAGVALVTSNLTWLAIFVVITGSIFLVIVLLLLVPLIIPISPKHYIPRLFLRCVFRVLLNIPKYDDVEDSS